MLKWADEIYCSKEIKNPGAIIMSVNGGSYDVPLFLIAISSNERDQLDVVRLSELVKANVRSRLGLIVGISGSMDEAYEVIASIAEEVHSETGGYDMRGYFLKQNNGAD